MTAPDVRIVDVREAVAPLQSDISNAYIEFRAMTASVVKIVSDVEREGERLVGYGFSSNGRYAQSGLLQERFIPRLTAAAPEDLADSTGSNLDPARVALVLMRNEKPGGHGERSVAVGVLDMAIWDLVAKIEDKPLYRVLAERHRGGATSDDSCSSTPPAATTTRARTSRRCARRWRAILTSGTPS